MKEIEEKLQLLSEIYPSGRSLRFSTRVTLQVDLMLLVYRRGERRQEKQAFTM